MYKEVNTGTNLPAQIDLYAVDGDEYKFLCIAKGGGSANKTYLYQETKALLTPGKLKITWLKNAYVGHCGLSAVSHRVRNQWNIGRSHAENGQTGFCKILRRTADQKVTNMVRHSAMWSWKRAAD